jgi:hypothetical protein
MNFILAILTILSRLVHLFFQLFRQNILRQKFKSDAVTLISCKDVNMGAGIAQWYLGYGLDDREFEPRRRLGIFLFTTLSRPALGPTQQPPIQ